MTKLDVGETCRSNWKFCFMKVSAKHMQTTRPKVGLLWFLTVDQGRNLELNASIGATSYSLASIVADDKDESLWFEVYIGETVVQIPIETVRAALDAASGNVHSESWYRRNSPDYQLDGLSPAARAFLKMEKPIDR